MTLSKETSNQIVKAEMPHYYELTLPNGTKRHCGTLKDVECMLSIYPDAIYAKILLPHPPKTVDVTHVELEPDLQLPEQKFYPNLTYNPLTFSNYDLHRL